jgi:hypothetical protein
MREVRRPIPILPDEEFCVVCCAEHRSVTDDGILLLTCPSVDCGRSVLPIPFEDLGLDKRWGFRPDTLSLTFQLTDSWTDSEKAFVKDFTS